MSEDIKEKRIETLKATQQNRKEESLSKVNKAIERLIKTGAKISFQSIAREANVSVPYLYKYPELKERIQNLRQQQTQMPSTPVNQPPVTAKAHSQVITRLKKRIHELESENKELKRKNEALAGQVYRVHSLQEQVERQKKIIETLENRLKAETQPTNNSKVIPLSPKSQAISHRILAELDEVGIQINKNLTSQIQAATESDVLAAIEYYKYEKDRTEIENPGGWLARAIKERWTKPNNVVQHNVVQPKFQSERVSSHSENFLLQNQKDREFASKEELANISIIFEEKLDD
jgi:hypothetical protein